MEVEMETKKQQYYREAERLFLEAAKLFYLLEDRLENSEEHFKLMAESLEELLKNIGELRNYMGDDDAK